jgi:hypothetical protein
MLRSSMKKVLFGMALVTAGFIGSSLAWADGPYAFTTFQAVPGVSTRAFGLNDNGDVVGIYYDTTGNGRGFLRSSTGAVSYIDTYIGGSRTNTWLESINNSSKIVGGYLDNGTMNAATYTRAGAMTPYVMPTYPGSTVTSSILDHISATGDFTGHYMLNGDSRFRGFYNKGRVQTEFSLPSKTVPGAYLDTQLDYINGNIVAGHTYGTNTTGFVFDLTDPNPLNWQEIAIPGYDETELERMNAKGDMVGYISTASPNATRGFVQYVNGDTWIFPDTVTDTSGKTYDVDNSFVEMINAKGVILGYFDITLPDGSVSQISFLGDPDPVPEPSTLLLTGAGITGLGLLKRRRNRKAR